jgi:inorganic pyrophosphatase/exopolyphosphatase
MFLDELSALYPNRDDITAIALVDHNQLDIEQEQWLGKNVTYIVDHHVDNHAYADTVKAKEVRFIGSACSLVALMFKNHRHLFEEDLAPGDLPNFAYLLAAAICLDSYNFLDELRDKKWNEDDIVAHKFLMETADVGTEYWKVLNDIKFDSKAALDLGLRAMFIRDYKKYDLKLGIIGISVVTAQVYELMEKFGEEALVAECHKMMTDYKLNMFSIMGIHANDGGHVDKSILLFINKQSDSDLAKSLPSLMDHIEGVKDFGL